MIVMVMYILKALSKCYVKHGWVKQIFTNIFSMKFYEKSDRFGEIYANIFCDILSGIKCDKYG